MGVFFDTFNEKIKLVWDVANQMDKPVNGNLTWTVGIINGRCDFKDLQAHGAALMASIIINEPVVPKIICAWDTPSASTTTARNLKARRRIYPMYLLRLFDEFEEGFLMKSNIYKCNHLQTKYVSLCRSGWSVNPYPGGLGLGYRAKYLGLNFVKTSHAIMSDIDTICANGCCEYVQNEIDKDPSTFCLTNHFDRNNVSVGLVAFNMEKYRQTYLPYWHEAFWELPHADAKHIQYIRHHFPHLKNELDLRLMDKNVINTERYHRSKPRKNDWVDDKSSHYHAWKGELKDNPGGFKMFYNQILDALIERGQNAV